MKSSNLIAFLLVSLFIASNAQIGSSGAGNTEATQRVPPPTQEATELATQQATQEATEQATQRVTQRASQEATVKATKAEPTGSALTVAPVPTGASVLSSESGPGFTVAPSTSVGYRVDQTLVSVPAPRPTAASAPFSRGSPPINEGFAPAPVFGNNKLASKCGDGVVTGNEKCEPSTSPRCCNSNCQWAFNATCAPTSITLLPTGGSLLGVECKNLNIFKCSKVLVDGIVPCTYSQQVKCTIQTKPRRKAGRKNNRVSNKQGFCQLQGTEDDPKSVKCTLPETKNSNKKSKKLAKLSIKSTPKATAARRRR